MDDAQADRAAFDTAERLLGAPLVLPLGPGEPPSGADFRRLATRHAFGDSWTRTGLDVRSRALVSVTIAATLGTREPLRGQLRIALNNGVTKDEIVDLFIHLEAYAGAARAFDSYQIALEIFAELRAPSRRPDPQAGAGREPYRAVRCPARHRRVPGEPERNASQAEPGRLAGRAQRPCSLPRNGARGISRPGPPSGLPDCDGPGRTPGPAADGCGPSAARRS